MNEREILVPGPDHPITIAPTDGRLVVRAGDVIIADTEDALTLRETTYPPRHYIPLDDIDAGALRPSETHTYCPYKGEASYYTVAAGGVEVEDAAWTYTEPYEAVAEIAGRVAFYEEYAEIEVEA